MRYIVKVIEAHTGRIISASNFVELNYLLNEGRVVVRRAVRKLKEEETQEQEEVAWNRFNSSS